MYVQTDPGVPIVYAGFGALMLTTCISYLSHTQVRTKNQKIGPFSFELKVVETISRVLYAYPVFCITRYGHYKTERRWLLAARLTEPRLSSRRR